MKIKVKEEDAAHTVKLKKGAKVEEALKKTDINRETVLVEKNGQVVSSEEELKDGDVLNTISIVSMG